MNWTGYGIDINSIISFFKSIIGSIVLGFYPRSNLHKLNEQKSISFHGKQCWKLLDSMTIGRQLQPFLRFGKSWKAHDFDYATRNMKLNQQLRVWAFIKRLKWLPRRWRVAIIIKWTYVYNIQKEMRGFGRNWERYLHLFRFFQYLVINMWKWKSS